LTKQDDSSVFGSPTYSRGTIYIGTSGPNNDDTRARGSVVALDEGTGKVRWQTYTVPEGRDGAAVWTTPAVDESAGRLYVGTGNNYHQPTTDTENAIVALDTGSGAIVGKYQATPNDAFAADNPTGPDADFGASPNLFDGPDGRHLVGEGQKSGVYWALDRATMQPVWQTTVGPPGILGGILGSTAVDGARIYGTDTLDGQVFALGLDGSPSWESPDTAGHLSPASIAHAVLYTTDPNGTLNARDPASGSILAKLPLDGPTFGGVSAAGAALFVAVGTGPPPAPAPQIVGPGSIVAFGDTSTAAAPTGRPGGGAARLRLSVQPGHVRAGRLVRLRVRATRDGKALAGVEIHLAGRRVRTGGDGRAVIRVRFRRVGLHVVRASLRGVGRANGRVRAIRGGG
jgi:outer membrane protein assembly factor BamB